MLAADFGDKTKGKEHCLSLEKGKKEKRKLKTLSTGEWINAVVYSYNGILFSNKNNILIDTTWMNLKNTLCNKSQKQESIYIRYDIHIRLRLFYLYDVPEQANLFYE